MLNGFVSFLKQCINATSTYRQMQCMAAFDASHVPYYKKTGKTFDCE